MARLAGSIQVAVGPSAKDFWPKFRVQTKNAPNLKVRVDPDLSRLRREIAAERKRQEANHIKIKTDLDRRSAERTRQSIQRIVHTWRQSDFSRAIRINVMVAGAASMPSLIQGLMSLTTAITELSRAALVLPGVFSGIGAAAGTAATGILGVADAFKEMDNGFDNTTQKMRLFQQSSRDLEQAQRGIVDALKEANRAIEDQQTKLTRNQLSVEQAQLNLQKANQRLAKGGFDSVTDWRQAVLDQKQAQLDLNETVRQSKRDIQDYYDSSRRGATESATFKDALDRLATAMENYEKRQIEASGVTEKFLQALEKLSPAARDFVVQVRGLSNVWGKLQNAVQEKLFQNLGDDIVKLTKSRLPMLQKGMEQVANGLNTNVRQILSSIGSDQNSDAISKIFERTGTALQRMNPGINSLLNAFLKLSEVGSRFLPRLSGAFNDLSKRFENFIDKTEADGSLKAWIDGGLRTVSALGRSLQSVLSIFGSITTAYQKATGNITGFAGTMDRGLASIAKRLASPEGQRAMIRWIGDAREFIDSIKQSLPGIRNIFQAIADGARRFAQVAFPIFAKIGEYAERFAWIVEPLIALWAIQRTTAPVWRTVADFLRKGTEGFKRYKDSVEAAKVAEQNLIDTKKSLQTQIASDQRTRAKEQIYLQNTLSRNKLDKQQAANSLDAAKQNLAQLKDQHRLNVESLRANQRLLGQVTDLSRPGGMQFREDGKPGRRTKIPVGFQERLAEIREMANKEAAAIRDMEARLLNGRGLPEGGVRRTQMEERLRIARVNLEAYNTALSGATSLEQTREDQWRRTQVAYDKVQRSQAEIAKGEKVVSAAVRNKEAVLISSLDRELDAKGRVADTDKRIRTNQAAIIDLDRQNATSKNRLVQKINSTVEGHTRLNRAWDTAKNKASSLRTIIGGRGGGGVSGALGAMVGAMGNVVRAIGSVGTIGLMFALDKLAQAHQKAGDRAAYQRDMENALASSLDQTTGAVTAAGVNEQVRRGQKFEITGGGNKTLTIDAIQSANDAGIPTDLLKRSLDPRQIEANNQVQKTLDDQTLAAVRSGKDDQWNKHGENLRKYGVSDEIYAKALNGDQDALRKFEKAKESIKKDNRLLSPNGPLPGWLDSINSGIQERLGQLPDLGAAAEQLTNAGVSSVGASQFQRSSERANASAGTDVKAANDKATIRPNSPFPGAENAYWDPDGKGVGFVMNNLSPDQRKYLEENIGADVSPSGSPGSYIVHITGDLVDKWVEPRPYARGGSVWGAGTATSDSIPALLSNGEYVINAKSASLIGHDTLNQINGITSSRGKMTGIPRFAPGGDVDPNDWVDLIGEASAKAAAETALNIPGQKLEVGSGQIPGSADQRPGEFDRGEFQSAGQAQAARRGTGPAGDPNRKTSPIVSAIAGAGNWIGENLIPFTPDTMTPERASDIAAGLGIPKAQRDTGEPFLPVWRDLFGVPAPGSKPPSLIPINAPLNGYPHAGSGQPGPGGQRSTRGFPVGQTPLPIRDPAKPPITSTPSSPSAPVGPVRPGQIPTYEQLPGGPAAPAAPSAPATPASPGGYQPLTPEQLASTDLTTPVPVPSGGATPSAETPGLAPASTEGAVPPAPESLVKQVIDFARIADGFNYEWGALRAPGTNGPDDPGAVDCSSLALAIARIATGKDPFAGGRSGFNTANQGDILARMGFRSGTPGPGDLVIGWTDRDGDGPDGHTGITLPDGTPIDAQNPGAGVVVGQGSGGAGGFDNVMYLPMGGAPAANIPTVGDISTAVPPPGAVTGGGGSGNGGIADGLPKISGPFGELPDQPVDIIRSIGEILLSAFLGFFGVNPDTILSIIRSIFGDDKKNEAEGDPGAVPEENPDPNIDPGPDQKVIDDLVKAAGDAKARGDEQLSRNLLQRARDYRQSRLASSAPPSTLGSLTLDSTPDVVAKAILSEARARGYTKEEAQAILATAINESGGKLNPRAITKGGNWLEIFQNPKNPILAGNPDPNANIQSFFDRLGEKTAGGGDIWNSILWTQQKPDAPNIDEALKQADPQYLNRIRGGADAARLYMEQLGYARGGLVRPFSRGGFATSGPDPLDIFGDPWDPWPSLDDMYGSGSPGTAFVWPLGVMSGQDPMNNARGGHIRGPGTSTSDSIPALLSDGEYVIKASAVKHWGVDKLDLINNPQGFSTGGYVQTFGPGGPVKPEPVNPLDPYLLPDGTPRPAGYEPALPDASTGPIDSIWGSIKKTPAYLGSVAKSLAPFVGLGGDNAPGVADVWSEVGSSVGELFGIASGSASGGGGSWSGTDDPSLANSPGQVAADAWKKNFLDAIHYEDYSKGNLQEGASKTIGDIAMLGAGKLLTNAVGKAASRISESRQAAKVSDQIKESVPEIAPPKTQPVTPPRPMAIAPPPSAANGINWSTTPSGLSIPSDSGRVLGIPVNLPGIPGDIAEAIVEGTRTVMGLQPQQLIRSIDAFPFEQRWGPKYRNVYAGADNGELKFNTDIFSDPERLIESVRADIEGKWTSGSLAPEDAIFNILAHEGFHPFADNSGISYGAFESLFSSTYAKLYPDMPINRYPDNFLKFLERILPGYAYLDRRDLTDGKTPNRALWWGDSQFPTDEMGWIDEIDSSIGNIDPIESFPIAAADVLQNGAKAGLGSRLLWGMLRDSRIGGLLPSVPLLRNAITGTGDSGSGLDIPLSDSALASIFIDSGGPKAISGSGFAKGIANGPLTPGQLAKAQLAGKNSGAVGGDFDAPNQLTREVYKKNNPRGGKGWFTPGGKLDTQKMVENLIARFNDTTGDKAWIRDAGMKWYSDARRYLTTLLEQSGQNWTLDQAAAALAALSGNTGWNENMRRAVQFFNDSNSLDDKMPGVLAAKRAIASDDPISVLGDEADKWKNFAAAILGIKYNGKDPVPVDRWAARAALGTNDRDFAEAVRGSAGGYDKIAEAYRIAAEQVGISPEQLQAVTWMHIIKPPDMAMWDDIANFRETGQWSWANDIQPLSQRGLEAIREPLRFGSVQEARDWANELYPKNRTEAASLLNEDQIRALIGYTVMPDVNNALRGIFNTTDVEDWTGNWGRRLAQYLLRDVPRLDSAIDAYPTLPADVMLYHRLRGEHLVGMPLPMGEDVTLDFLRRMLIGEEMTVDGYLSTTMAPWRAGQKPLLEIMAPKGTRGIWLGGDPGGIKAGSLSDYPNEAEFFSDRGQTIRFEDIFEESPALTQRGEGLRIMSSLIQPETRPPLPDLPSDLAALFEKYRAGIGFDDGGEAKKEKHTPITNSILSYMALYGALGARLLGRAISNPTASWSSIFGFQGKASGGYISGPGGPTSDQIPALLSDGEYVIRAAAVKHWGVDRLDAINSMRGFALGGLNSLLPIVMPPAAPPPPPTKAADAPVETPRPPADPADPLANVPNLGKQVEAAASAASAAALAPKGGGSGGSASAPAPKGKDPRSIMGAAPTSGEHNNPALSAGIKGAFNTIGSIASTAASAAIASSGAGAAGAGAAAGSLISAGAQMAGDVASGAMNILSSLGVGTVTPSQTGQGYGAPLLSQQQTQPRTTNYQSIHNGNIVTNNLTEYSRLKDRKDAQKSAPFFNRVNA